MEISFPKEEAEVFGIWKDRKDIKSAIGWAKGKRMAEMVIFDSDILIDYFKEIVQVKEFIFKTGRFKGAGS